MWMRSNPFRGHRSAVSGAEVGSRPVVQRLATFTGLALAAGLAAVVLIASISSATVLGAPPAAAPVHLVIDGQAVAPDPPPWIENGRAMVPLREVFERLGAEVNWDNDQRLATAQRGDRWVQLRIGDSTACLDKGCATTVALDVPARIYDKRTFVPARFVAESLGAFVDWVQASRTVIINTDGEGGAGTPGAAITPGDAAGVPVAIPADTGAVRVATVQPSQQITGAVTLQLQVTDPALAAAAKEVRYMLLHPETGRGPVVARGAAATASYEWLPDPVAAGNRILFAGLYDVQGQRLAGQAVPVTMAVTPTVAITGPKAGQTVTGAVELTAKVNFRATHVRYELVPTNGGSGGDTTEGQSGGGLGNGSGGISGSGSTTGPGNNRPITIAAADPYGPFSWTPQPTLNGSWILRAVAVDRLGNEVSSVGLPITIAVPRRLAMTGLKAGTVVDRPVTLGVSINYPIREVRYVVRDPATGREDVPAIYKGPSQHRWLPTVAQAGAREVLVAVIDTAGQVQRSEAVTVTVSDTPGLYIQTVGPNQVLAGTVDLRAAANVPLSRIAFRLLPTAGGAGREIVAGSGGTATYQWTPAAGDAGNWRLQAVGTTTAGAAITSEALPVKVHVGPLYPAQPVIAKDRFKDFAAGLARPAQGRTGMSAAVQVAQAILETGWGQSSPVDKYTGQRSNNLFGIKGKGPAGSVTSNTWEEYFGVAFRVDAAFRAYNNLQDSWDDHKRLLLTSARYEPFRAVMHDGIRGAWALRRAGYATDSQYPVKLINLMREYDLFDLEEVVP